MEQGVTYMGRVVSIDDNRREGRIKVEIANVTEGLTLDELIWCYPMHQNFRGSLNLPNIDDVVEVIFNNGNKYDPRYSLFTTFSDELRNILNESYENARIVFFDEVMNSCLYYTVERGLYMENDGTIVQLRKDNSVYIQEKEGKTIHLNDGKISIGSEKESDEPAVLGVTNEEVLNQLVDAIKEIVKITKTEMNLIADAANASTTTLHLTVPIKKFTTTLEASLNSITQEILNKIPDTKSKTITLDK